MHLRLITGFVIPLAVGCAVASAAYIQDFDSLQSGTINGQDQWTANAWDVVQSTTAKSGQALQVTYPSNPKAVSRAGIFDDAAAVPKVRLQMDINLSATGNSYAGQSNKSSTYFLNFVGPPPQSGDPQYVRLIYDGQTDSFGAISKDFFTVSGLSNTTSTQPVLNNTWYHVIADFNWAQNSADFRIENPNGSTLFDPPVAFLTTQHSVGGSFYFNSIGTTPANLFMDNINVSPLPEPTALISGVALLGLMRRRRRNVRRLA